MLVLSTTLHWDIKPQNMVQIAQKSKGRVPNGPAGRPVAKDQGCAALPDMMLLAPALAQRDYSRSLAKQRVSQLRNVLQSGSGNNLKGLGCPLRSAMSPSDLADPVVSVGSFHLCRRLFYWSLDAGNSSSSSSSWSCSGSCTPVFLTLQIRC